MVRETFPTGIEGRLGVRVEAHSSLPSTNDRALELARSDAPEGTIVVADEQTAGKGQRGAPWRSLPGAGLYASVLLRPRLDFERSGLLTLMAGVAVHDAIDRFLPGSVGLKWPNDVLARPEPHTGAKVAGILVEASGDLEGLRYAVVGIGINRVAAPRLPDRRTACLRDFGPPPSRAALLGAVVSCLEGQLALLETQPPRRTLDAWTDRALGLGEAAELTEGTDAHRGRFLGLDPEGSAEIALDDGTIRTFRHGRLRLALEAVDPGVPP